MDEIWVTGLGVVTPIGQTVPEFWRSLAGGRSGAAPVTAFSTEGLKTRIGCEVRGFDAGARLGAAARDLGRATAMTLAAAFEALAEAGLAAAAGGAGDPPFALAADLDRQAAGVSIGTTLGEPGFLEAMASARLDPDPRWAGVTRFPASAIAEGLAAGLGLRGPLLTLPTACAAGNYAIADATELLRAGEAEVMLAGGADAFSRSAFIGFARLHAMSADVCRPFDGERQGLLLGEGAAILVLERAAHARARGARPLARVLGVAQSCDGYHITGPHPEGRGAARVMAGALADAGLGPGDVDYINAHGTGTPHNDRIESLAIRTVFGRRAEQVPVSSIKALTGHTMGAAGAIESVASILALRLSTIPPTWNFRTPDPDCPLDVVPNAPRPAALRTVLNNSYAFGGNNASILFGHVDA